MNLESTMRLLWKETHVQLPFSIACLAMGWLAQMAVVAGNQILASGVQTEDITAWLYYIPVVMTALHAAGSAAMCFALEEEQGTAGLLRALPVTSRRVVTTKVLHSLVGTLACGAILWVTTPCWGYGWPTFHLGFQMFLSGGILLAIWAWTLYFSLHQDGVITTLCRGVGAALLTWGAIANAVTAVAPHLQDAAATMLVAIPAIAPPVVGIMRGGSRWIDRPKRREHQQDASTAGGLASYFADSVFQPHRSGFAWLVWLQFRQSWGLFALFAWWPLLAWFLFRDGLDWDRFHGWPLPWLCVCFPFPAAAMTFAGDWKRSNYRFFASRGISPRAV